MGRSIEYFDGNTPGHVERAYRAKLPRTTSASLTTPIPLRLPGQMTSFSINQPTNSLRLDSSIIAIQGMTSPEALCLTWARLDEYVVLGDGIGINGTPMDDTVARNVRVVLKDLSNSLTQLDGYYGARKDWGLRNFGFDADARMGLALVLSTLTTKCAEDGTVTLQEVVDSIKPLDYRESIAIGSAVYFWATRCSSSPAIIEDVWKSNLEDVAAGQYAKPDELGD